MWLHSFHLILQNPIFGVGLGNFTVNGQQDRPHNEYLQYAVNTGIIGGLLYIAFLITLLVRAIKNRKETNNITFITGICIFCYLISAFFGNTMPHVMPTFITMLAFFISTLTPTKKGSN